MNYDIGLYLRLTILGEYNISSKVSSLSLFQNFCQLVTKSIQNGLENACTYISPYLSPSLKRSLNSRFDKELKSFGLLCEIF